MRTAVAEAVRDYLVRFQQTALKETGRRPLAYRREPMDEALVLAGCHRPGYVFWQPMAWPGEQPPLGAGAEAFDESILGYLSLCQFLEIRFRLPVAPMSSPLSFLYDRVFEAYRNTVLAPPARAFEEAALYARANPRLPLSFCMAATCDGGEPLMLQLRASDGQMYVAGEGREPLYCRLTVERLLPKLHFVYDL